MIWQLEIEHMSYNYSQLYLVPPGILQTIRRWQSIIVTIARTPTRTSCSCTFFASTGRGSAIKHLSVLTLCYSSFWQQEISTYKLENDSWCTLILMFLALRWLIRTFIYFETTNHILCPDCSHYIKWGIWLMLELNTRVYHGSSSPYGPIL